MPVRLAIAGASGRMGQALIEAALQAPDLALASARRSAAMPASVSDG